MVASCALGCCIFGYLFCWREINVEFGSKKMFGLYAKLFCGTVPIPSLPCIQKSTWWCRNLFGQAWWEMVTFLALPAQCWKRNHLKFTVWLAETGHNLSASILFIKTEISTWITTSICFKTYVCTYIHIHTSYSFVLMWIHKYRYDYTHTWTLPSRSLPVVVYCSSRADFRFLALLTGHAILSGVIPRANW